eukprot:scaffold234519_cov25-Prasinocladus_malaysianus.AAC.2
MKIRRAEVGHRRRRFDEDEDEDDDEEQETSFHATLKRGCMRPLAMVFMYGPGLHVTGRAGPCSSRNLTFCGCVRCHQPCQPAADDGYEIKRNELINCWSRAFSRALHAVFSAVGMQCIIGEGTTKDNHSFMHLRWLLRMPFNQLLGQAGAQPNRAWISFIIITIALIMRTNVKAVKLRYNVLAGGGTKAFEGSQGSLQPARSEGE